MHDLSCSWAYLGSTGVFLVLSICESRTLFSVSSQFVNLIILLYPLFSLEKEGILISYQSRSVVRLSVRTSVRLCVRGDVRPSCFL